MFGRILTEKSTESFSDNIKRLIAALEGADAVIIGAGAGLSTSAGLEYSGERFKVNFAEFERKYGFHDMYSGGFYPYDTLEEYWAFWSRSIYVNRYSDIPKPVYECLYELVCDKDYFVLTTNVDHCFQRAGFDKNRLFYTQGDYGLWQCSKPCHAKTYDNEDSVRRMLKEQTDIKIPSSLIPYCPV
ncbi:MAG: Sir2 silent information regulator family NAD-dependent deacetylase, partial [Firmicutes bacterium]|nr:Sir2 silent information regulator family NAD-dependent deacetylase [Bacillota bacterium]